MLFGRGAVGRAPQPRYFVRSVKATAAKGPQKLPRSSLFSCLKASVVPTVTFRSAQTILTTGLGSLEMTCSVKISSARISP